MSLYIGIDSGGSGGISGLVDHTDLDPKMPIAVHFLKSKDATDKDVADWLHDICSGRTLSSKCVIEKVSSSPQMGVVSAFTFGRSYGFLQGCLAAEGIPYALVTPQKWQKAMGCMTKGDKNVSKAAAQRLYPKEKITHANADALLLATYCRRYHAELF
jgi:Holliday junction resolvasome RuvABC endonuclease subunit